EIPLVVGHFLVIPAQLAGVGVERHDAGCIELGFLALVGADETIAIVEIAARIAGAPIDKVEIGIERAGHPRRAAAELPAVALPCLMALFPGTGNHVPAPCEAAGLCVESGEIAAMCAVPARAPDDHFVFDD